MSSNEAYFTFLICTSTQTSQHAELSHKILVFGLKFIKGAQKGEFPTNGHCILMVFLKMHVTTVLLTKQAYF